MIGKEMYKVYAPAGTMWTQWVRPVPFVAIDTYNRKLYHDWLDVKIMFLSKYKNDTAIFVDLPNGESIEFGISLARLGYRPIPLFNGTDGTEGSQNILDTHIIESYLINGAQKLKDIEIRKDANPVFMLDSCRTNRYRKRESTFDNSWDIYRQDIPTAEYFKQNGINKIIVVGDGIQKDLKKIFLKFQKVGIEFYMTDGFSAIKKVVLKRSFKELFEKEEL